MPADDERRAVIEAAVVEFFRKVDVNGGIPACPVTIYAKAAARLREVADRVRDARGDDERVERIVRDALELPDTIPLDDPVTVLAGNYKTAKQMLAARSPQDEDHEAGETWTIYVCPECAIVDHRPIGGHHIPHGGVCPSPQLERVEVSRVSPSRDGTVAVEDMAEAAARAMFEHHYHGSDHDPADYEPSLVWADLEDSSRDYWRQLAYAALSRVSSSRSTADPKEKQ